MASIAGTADMATANPESSRPPSLGESRVRIGFNPSSDTTVDAIKRSAANFIDLCESLRPKYDGARQASPPGNVDALAEIHRCLSLAQTHAEDAAMWAVKAATAGK